MRARALSEPLRYTGTLICVEEMERPMEKLPLRLFQREVEHQCDFAIMALEDMEEAKANSDGKLFWYSVQSLMVAIGRISRLLWPPDSDKSERRAKLRESLDVEEDSPLNALTFVEHFEHFDERLEEWYESSENLRYFDSYTEPLDVLAETSPKDRFRGFDTEKNAIIFHGDLYYLEPVIEAMNVFARRRKQRLKSRVWAVDKGYSP
jgi:hypothetical protein